MSVRVDLKGDVLYVAIPSGVDVVHRAATEADVERYPEAFKAFEETLRAATLAQLKAPPAPAPAEVDTVPPPEAPAPEDFTFTPPPEP